MPIGTSLGGFFKTEAEFHMAPLMDSRDNNITIPNSTGDILDIDPFKMQMNKMVGQDVHNITNDAGVVVDYDNSIPASQLNDIDAAATPQTPNDRVQAGFDALKQ